MVDYGASSNMTTPPPSDRIWKLGQFTWAGSGLVGKICALTCIYAHMHDIYVYMYINTHVMYNSVYMDCIYAHIIHICPI
jgi:hypothetical protein